MSRIEIREERCKGCLLCTQVCPQTILVQSSRFNAQGYKVVFHLLRFRDKLKKCIFDGTAILIDIGGSDTARN